MTVRRRRRTKPTPPARERELGELDEHTRAAVLPPHERMLSFMASFSSVTGHPMIAGQYLDELTAHIQACRGAF